MYICIRLCGPRQSTNPLCTMQIERKYTIGFDSEWDVPAVHDALCGARRAVLVAHTNADGDAVGSVCGMYHLCRMAAPGLLLTPMLPDGVPDELAWLPGTEAILSGAADEARCREAIAEADLIIGLDISGLGRTGHLETALRGAKAAKMMVDHHESPEREVFGTVVSEPEASSTCELVYWLMRETFGERIFTPEAATCLYTGICTDTGTFSYSNDRESVYLAAAELLRQGIDPMHINRQIKNVFTVARLQFFGFAMAHRLTVYKEPKVALMVLSSKEIADGGVVSSELTGLINEVMKLKDIDCGILVREETTCGHTKIRLSLRSKEQYDVNLLARELFGGGGHKRAAGATSTVGLNETVKIIKQRLHLEDR